jgi:hypothetical protein
LGYQFLVRLPLAAVASLGQSAGAIAGAIEGSIIFPGQLAPSITVYASDLDTARLHSVQPARGKGSFILEVPPGRYLVFLAPNETGAPNIYAAYTRYSLCSPHDVDDKCADHALIPVAVSAQAPHARVTIDDWYLTDEVADRIDRIREAAAGDIRFNSEPLSAPRFSEYPSAPFDPSTVPHVDFSGSALSEEDREIVQRALSGGPNFAGVVTAALTHCGPACSRLVLVDWRSGQIQEPAPLAEIQGTLPCRPGEAVLFRRDSRLMSISRTRGATVVTQYFVWNQKNGSLAQSGEYQRTSPTFCAVAAR